MLLNPEGLFILTLYFVLYIPIISRISDITFIYKSNRKWKAYWEKEREKTIQVFIETNASSTETIDKVQQLEVLQKIWIPETKSSVLSLKNFLMVLIVLANVAFQLLALFEAIV